MCFIFKVSMVCLAAWLCLLTLVTGSLTNRVYRQNELTKYSDLVHSVHGDSDALDVEGFLPILDYTRTPQGNTQGGYHKQMKSDVARPVLLRVRREEDLADVGSGEVHDVDLHTGHHTPQDETSTLHLNTSHEDTVADLADLALTQPPPDAALTRATLLLPISQDTEVGDVKGNYNLTDDVTEGNVTEGNVADAEDVKKTESNSGIRYAIIMGSVVIFWILMAPVVCLFCRWRDNKTIKGRTTPTKQFTSDLGGVKQNGVNHHENGVIPAESCVKPQPHVKSNSFRLDKGTNTPRGSPMSTSNTPRGSLMSTSNSLKRMSTGSLKRPAPLPPLCMENGTPITEEFGMNLPAKSQLPAAPSEPSTRSSSIAGNVYTRPYTTTITFKPEDLDGLQLRTKVPLEDKSPRERTLRSTEPPRDDVMSSPPRHHENIPYADCSDDSADEAWVLDPNNKYDVVYIQNSPV